MRSPVVLVPGLAAAICLPVSVAAQPAMPPPIHETVVVTGTAAPEIVGNVGRAVVVLTRDDLARLPLASVADVLRLVASVDVRERGARGVQADFSVRGAGFGQVLVLVDGTRLNDAQSGHHNSDIPVGLDDIERIEVLLGAGASLHGADAVGGTINVITRRPGARMVLEVAGGQHGLVEAGGSAGLEHPAWGAHALSAELLRSSGFAPVRDHLVRLARYQGHLRGGTAFSVAHLDKAFGASGFYGPAPSREWTDQTLARLDHPFEVSGRWRLRAEASYRRHGDRFVYDARTPSLSANTHRTHALTAHVRGSRTMTPATQISVGAGAGSDWIRSSNLGTHTFARGSAFVEMRQAAGSRVLLHPGLRVDTYSRFGTSWSPAVSVTGRASARGRWRASAGRAFRVPTFTELYYTDPNHDASAALLPETAWSVDGGGDWFSSSWTGSVTVFSRREARVIDWVRAEPTERWRTTNVHRVGTHGAEIAVRRRFGPGAQIGAGYTRLSSAAPSLHLLSKYVLDYARHALVASASTDWRGLSLGARVGARQHAGRGAYQVVDIRIARRIGRVDVYVEAANALDEQYEEIRGVAMPGRWARVGMRVR